jgi:hypothetical protein
LPNYGFYGLEQPVAASSEPSGIDDPVVRPDTRLSDRRKTRIPSNDGWFPNQTRLFAQAATILEAPSLSLMTMQRIEVGTTYAPQAPIDDIQKVLMSVLETFEESSGIKITRLLRVEFWQTRLILSRQDRSLQR